MTTVDVRKLVSEKDFMASVVDLARLQDWLVYYIRDSRRSPAGYPDLTLVRPPRVLYVECKSKRGTLDMMQKVWVDALHQCQGVETYVWRPNDWDWIEKVLARE